MNNKQNNNNNSRNKTDRKKIHSIYMDQQCCTCYETRNDMFQCKQHHVVCNLCFDRIYHSEQPSCPQCREPYDIKLPREWYISKTLEKTTINIPNKNDNIIEHLSTRSRNIEVKEQYFTISAESKKKLQTFTFTSEIKFVSPRFVFWQCTWETSVIIFPQKQVQHQYLSLFPGSSIKSPQRMKLILLRGSEYGLPIVPQISYVFVTPNSIDLNKELINDRYITISHKIHQENDTNDDDDICTRDTLYSEPIVLNLVKRNSTTNNNNNTNDNDTNAPLLSPSIDYHDGFSLRIIFMDISRGPYIPTFSYRESNYTLNNDLSTSPQSSNSNSLLSTRDVRDIMTSRRQLLGTTITLLHAVLDDDDSTYTEESLITTSDEENKSRTARRRRIQARRYRLQRPCRRGKNPYARH